MLQSLIYYLINFIKGTFLFTVILLLGSGWSFFKPFLSTKERRVIYLVFLLQVIDNVAILVLSHETMGEKYYSNWSAILHLVDIVSCCAILIPIVWQVNTLERSVEDVANENENEEHQPNLQNDEMTMDDETKRLQTKLSLFRSFYIAVVAYIYFTRIVVYLFASTLSYNQTWLKYFVSEVGTLLFYMVIGIKFKPAVESEYMQVGSDEGSEENKAAKHKDNSIELGVMVHTKE
jgi:Lung seven transmembrane receptor.